MKFDKFGYVRERMRSPARGHHCHWPGCERAVPAAMWGCKKHWFMLPAGIRNRIWKTFDPGQEETKTPSREYVAAAKEAQEWILEHHPPAPTLL